jgi:hypothetical protein
VRNLRIKGNIMEFNLGVQVGAKFKLVVHKGDGKPVRETSWFHNLVLDSGLDRLSVGPPYDRCCVGTGNSTPTTTQTQLDNFVGSTTTIQAESAGQQTSNTPYYMFNSIQWRFAQGVATGNISEVALGWSNTSLFNRALIKDGNGNPTTITVLSDEYLDVYSEVRGYLNQNISGSFNLLDKVGSVISQHTYIGAAKFVYGGTNGRLNKLSVYGNSYPHKVWSGVIQSGATSAPSGTSNGTFVVGTSNSYPTSRKCQAVCTFGLTEANMTHQTIVFNINGFFSGSGYANFQIQISPTIAKTSSQVMTYTVELTWDRYTP